MHTFFDCPEITQVYWFMKYLKSSYLDLQFILSKSAKQAKYI